MFIFLFSLLLPYPCPALPLPSRQKVTLWQHADDLEQEQVAMGRWLESKDITECMNCNLTFTMFTRKVSGRRLEQPHSHSFREC